jgi:uncharacterized membrane protein YedE/YeeE
MNKNHTYLGLGLLVLLILSAYTLLQTNELFYRLLIGLGFGYALTRAGIGFAGSVNKLTRSGSSALATALMFMFILTAFVTSFIIYGDESSYKLSIYPINLGLILGGLFFGFGMTLSSCCATGSLTDLASGFSRASVTIFFFSIGVFLGFKTQSSASFVTDSWISSKIGASSKGGVFLPDLFRFDGLHGYLGAILLSAIFASLVVYLAKRYEKSYNKANNVTIQKEKKVPSSIFEKLFVNPWNMRVSIVIIALLFASLLLIYAKGWGASSTFGFWFAKLLMVFGVEAQTLADFTSKSVSLFNTPLLEHGSSIQNFSIILGAVFYLQIAGAFSTKFIAGLSINPKDFLVFALGGFMMGIGTRLSNGCNVGALYTPIAELSLSGWVYLVVVATGGFIGNWYRKNYLYKTCSI